MTSSPVCELLSRFINSFSNSLMYDMIFSLPVKLSGGRLFVLGEERACAHRPADDGLVAELFAGVAPHASVYAVEHGECSIIT